MFLFAILGVDLHKAWQNTKRWLCVLLQLINQSSKQAISSLSLEPVRVRHEIKIKYIELIR